MVAAAVTADTAAAAAVTAETAVVAAVTAETAEVVADEGVEAAADPVVVGDASPFPRSPAA